MKYKSTRGKVKGISFKEAVMMGLAEDGGLIIPESIPSLNQDELSEMSTMEYKELAFTIMKKFIDDISDKDLSNLIEKSYSTFNDEDIVPIVSFGNIHIAELFHGPTLAFKDVALQFLGNLFEFILKQKNENMNIIGATSGDTGSAAIHGVKGKENINICILHPEGKVSQVQELQMTTVDDPNVFNIAIKGNFDDCQAIVKEIFADVELKKELKLGAVNSINWARILAQVVYYFWAYFRVSTENKKTNIVVPTGNFGNIFAGIIAKKMGLNINKLILATNENNILSRFIKNGDYSLKEVVQTYSPSMDIQIASNFERYLFYLFDEDSQKIIDLMNELKEKQKITFDKNIISKVQTILDTYDTSNEETIKTIKTFFEDFNYILDPHTACGINATLNNENFTDEEFICLATAHPAKFGDVVVKSIGIEIEYPQTIKELFGKIKKMYKMNNSTKEVIQFLRNNLV